MRLLIIALLFLTAMTVVVSPQVPGPNLPPNAEAMRQLEWRVIRRRLDNLDTLHKTSVPVPRSSEDSRRIVLDTLYRRSRNDELLLLSPEVEDSEKYAVFLKQPGAGLTKLIRDFGCDEYSSVQPNQQICAKFTMPGGGSAFSFRVSDYQQWRLADMLYDGKSFVALGEMSLGMLVDLGDVPLENVRTETKGMGYLVRFEPSGDVAEATRQNTSLADGVTDAGFLYRKFLPALAGHTYVIRSVAFRGNVPREHYGAKYNELDFDKRKDITVAFRVVRRDFNGTVTIAWRVLQAKQAPVLNTAK